MEPKKTYKAYSLIFLNFSGFFSAHIFIPSLISNIIKIIISIGFMITEILIKLRIILKENKFAT